MILILSSLWYTPAQDRHPKEVTENKTVEVNRRVHKGRTKKSFS